MHISKPILNLSTEGFRMKLILLIVTSIILALVVQPVWAGSSNTIPRYGFLSGVTAYAYVKSLQIPESSNGDCGIKSYTSPATNINVVG